MSKILIPKDSYLKIITIENAIKAFKNAYKNNSNKVSAEKYFMSLDRNVYDLCIKLLTKSYKVGKMNSFKVYDPKERTIKALPFKDRVCQHILYDYLVPKYEKTFIYHSYSNRKNKGTLKGLKQEQIYLRKCGKGSYILKGDIFHFFDSINKKILIKILKKKIKDDDVIWLCKKFINIDKNKKGIAIGNVTSQLFANIYMNEMDHYIKDKLHVKYYIRYMDDFVINVKTKQEAIDILNKIKLFLKDQLDLELNDKTQIFPEKQGVNFLGAMIKWNSIKMRIQTIKRIKKKIKHFVKGLNNPSKTTQFHYKRILYKSFISWYGLAKHMDCLGILLKLFNYLKSLELEPFEGNHYKETSYPNLLKIINKKLTYKIKKEWDIQDVYNLSIYYHKKNLLQIEKKGYINEEMKFKINRIYNNGLFSLIEN